MAGIEKMVVAGLTGKSLIENDTRQIMFETERDMTLVACIAIDIDCDLPNAFYLGERVFHYADISEFESPTRYAEPEFPEDHGPPRSVIRLDGTLIGQGLAPEHPPYVSRDQMAFEGAS